MCIRDSGDTQGFLRSRLGSQPGEIVDGSGAVLGQHDGAYAFTVGQRKGLSIGRPAPDGKPRYVLSVEPVNNRVVVGSVDELAVQAVEADRAVWFADTDGTFACSLQVRAHGSAVPARATVRDGNVEIVLDSSGDLRGVAPGQSAVLYDGTRVLGQATVTAAQRATAGVVR